MSDVASERPPKRITVTVPCELAEKIERERRRTRRKFGPMLVRLAEVGLGVRERQKEKRDDG